MTHMTFVIDANVFMQASRHTMHLTSYLRFGQRS